MPKAKKTPKTAYYFFISARKAEMENEGHHIGSFHNAQQTFDHEWSQLSKGEKAPYEQMAKEVKQQEKLNISNKYTVTGESYAQLHRKEMEQRTATDQMKEFIKLLTTGPEAGDRMIILIKAVHSVEEIGQSSRSYWPIELSLGAFSLREGMRAIYSTLVDTQETPLGYLSEAQETCETTLLPMPGDKLYSTESRNYLQIMQRINGFTNHWLKDGYSKPHRHVFFALEPEIEPTKGCIQWIVDRLTGRDKVKYQRFLDNLKVYTLTQLVIYLSQEANRVNPKYNNYLVSLKLETAAVEVVTKGKYDYKEEIACRYHRSEIANTKIHMCTQSVVMRRAFLLFEEFISAFKFEWKDRHDINKLGRPNKRSTAKTKQEEEEATEKVIVEELGWLTVGKKAMPLTPCKTMATWSRKPEDKSVKDVNAWAQRRGAEGTVAKEKEVALPTSSIHPTDFPLLGTGCRKTDGSPGSVPQTAGRPRGGNGGMPQWPGAGGDEDFPTLGAVVSGGWKTKRGGRYK